MNERDQFVAKVVEEVCTFNGLSVQEVKGPTRSKRYIITRCQAYVILKTDLKMTTIEIGELFNRDHTTILHALKKVDNRTFPGIINDITILRNIIEDIHIEGTFRIKSRMHQEPMIEFVYGINQDCFGIYKMTMV